MIKDITGNKYGNLTVLRYSRTYKYKSRWICKCECGNEVEVLGGNLKSGHTKSCGCLIKKLHLSRKDIVGNKYGMLTVISYSRTNKKTAMWICACDCGNQTEVSGGHLKSGDTKSCGCLKSTKSYREDFTNKKFGFLTAISFSVFRKGHTYWNCVCDCGNHKIVDAGNLKSGHTTSCGCYKKTKGTTHNMSRTRFYRIWRHIIRRCFDVKAKCYYRYGGRGITVCDRWLESFENFRDDMLEEYNRVVKDTPNCQIDRIDNDGNYEPSNCRWVSVKVNVNNRVNIPKNRMLNKGQVTKIREMYKTGNFSQQSIADEFNASRESIKSIVNYKSYKDIK